MPIDYKTLQTTPRLLMEVELRPLQGGRFQPTGFADLGPARYAVPSKDGDGAVEMLLVESAQSVANRMELACWDEANDELIPELRGLPYIVVDSKTQPRVTNSVLEAHRINSEYIVAARLNGKPFGEFFAAEIGYKSDSPIDFRRFYKALFKYDLNSLIHGVFLEEIGGRLRVTRALSGFIEAEDVSVAESGGVKNNRVQPELKGGEGNVPFHRTEFVARMIKAYFNPDFALLRGYGLGEEATQLLIALALFKIRRFLSTGLRLRTACDLEAKSDLRVTRPDGFPMPAEMELLTECTRLIGACKGKFAGVTTVTWEANKKKKAVAEPVPEEEM